MVREVLFRTPQLSLLRERAAAVERLCCPLLPTTNLQPTLKRHQLSREGRQYVRSRQIRALRHACRNPLADFPEISRLICSWLNAVWSILIGLQSARVRVTSPVPRASQRTRERCPRGCLCWHSSWGQPQPTSPGPLSSRTRHCRRLLLQRPSRAAACGQPPLRNRATTGAVPAMIINGPQCRTGAPTHAPIVRTLAAKNGAAPSTRPRTRQRRRRHQYRRRSRRRSRRRD